MASVSNLQRYGDAKPGHIMEQSALFICNGGKSILIRFLFILPSLFVFSASVHAEIVASSGGQLILHEEGGIELTATCFLTRTIPVLVQLPSFSDYIRA